MTVLLYQKLIKFLQKSMITHMPPAAFHPPATRRIPWTDILEKIPILKCVPYMYVYMHTFIYFVNLTSTNLSFLCLPVFNLLRITLIWMYIFLKYICQIYLNFIEPLELYWILLKSRQRKQVNRLIEF